MTDLRTPREVGEPASTATSSAWSWVTDLAPTLGEIDPATWSQLGCFDRRLQQVLADPTAPPATPPTSSRRRPAQRLLELRAQMAPGTVLPPPVTATDRLAAAAGEDRHAGGRRCPVGRGPAGRTRDALAQTIRQFLAGFRDLDLRDVSGPGHGQLVLRHARSDVARAWAQRFDDGELAGIAMTESRGGSRLTAVRTRLVDDGPGRWRLSGRKVWISRLSEASVFVVSAIDPAGRTVAVLVEADRDGLHRTPQEPAGLRGWSWGALEFDGVALRHDDLLRTDESRHGAEAPPGVTSGGAVFAEHFASYRQLVTATALGAAAGVAAQVTDLLRARLARGEISRVGDHALIALSGTDAALRAALGACLHTARLAAAGHPHALDRSAACKAHGVETARRAVDDLAALAGAAGFARTHPIAKTRADLEALRFADGAHDSLHRSAGARLLHPATPETT